MIEPIESFADQLDAHIHDAEDAWKRGVLSDRDLAEWIKLDKDFALLLQRWLAKQGVGVVYAEA